METVGTVRKSNSGIINTLDKQRKMERYLDRKQMENYVEYGYIRDNFDNFKCDDADEMGDEDECSEDEYVDCEFVDPEEDPATAYSLNELIEDLEYRNRASFFIVFIRDIGEFRLYKNNGELVDLEGRPYSEGGFAEFNKCFRGRYIVETE
jgi:hypothetical protein